MADTSARESIISANIDTIMKNFHVDTGDTEQIGTSVLREEDGLDSLNSENRRLIRQQAKLHMDRIIEDKLKDPDLAEIDSIEEALERISRERQLEREHYRTAVSSESVDKKRKKKKNRKSRLSRMLEATPAEQMEIAEALEIVEPVRTVEVPEIAEAETPEISEFIEIPEAASPIDRVEITEIEDRVQIAETKAPEPAGKTVEFVEIDEVARVLDLLEEEEPADDRLDLYIDRILFNLRVKIEDAWGALAKKTTWLTAKAHPLGSLISVKEALLSDKMAIAVDRTDLLLDKLLSKGEQRVILCVEQQRCARCWCEDHKRRLLSAAAGLAILAGCASIVVGNITAYEYMYNGKVMGTVKDQQDVYKTIDIIGDKLTFAYGAEITIDKEKDISFRKVMGIGLEVDSREDVLDQFTYLRDMNATAYAINVDGRQKAILYNKKCAEKILKEIQSRYLVNSDSVAYESVGFAENVQVAEVNTKIGNIQEEADVLEYMLTGAVEIKTYEVKSGDTFNQIARNLGLSPDELQSTNSGVDPAKLQIGQELVLNRVRPVLTVQTTEIAEYTVPIDFEIDYEETATLYKGEQTVKSSGVKGERRVVAEIVRNNGEEVRRNELSSETLSEPKSQVVLKGTKDLPPLIGSGKLIYPTRGRLSSGFGTRWGRMHNGIDLAASTGTKIRAADGGKVISAGWEGALGYCVRIDHGQNMTTVYGHCSKLFVKAGDKVYKDQHIANVGNTGRSTGSHLHFEVHINGVPKNPLKYLN